MLTAQQEAPIRYSPQHQMNGDRNQTRNYRNDQFTKRNEFVQESVVREKKNDYVPSRFQRIERDSDSDEDDDDDEEDESGGDEDEANKTIRYSKYDYPLSIQKKDVETGLEVKLDNTDDKTVDKQVQENSQKSLESISVSKAAALDEEPKHEPHTNVDCNTNHDSKPQNTRVEQNTNKNSCILKEPQEDDRPDDDRERRNSHERDSQRSSSYSSSNREDYNSGEDRRSNRSYGSPRTDAHDLSGESVVSNAEISNFRDGPSRRPLSKVEFPSSHKRNSTKQESARTASRSPIHERIGEMSDYRRRSRSGSHDSDFRKRHYSSDRRHFNDRSDYHQNDRSTSNSGRHHNAEDSNRKRTSHGDRHSKRYKTHENISREFGTTDQRNNCNDHHQDSSSKHERRDESKTARLRSFIIQN